MARHSHRTMLASLLCGVVSIMAYTPGHAKTMAQPWPMPQEFTTSGDILALAADFRFTVMGHDCLTLRSALNRYAKLIYYRPQSMLSKIMKVEPFVTKFSRGPSFSDMTELKVNLMASECEEWPRLGMDESYDLELTMTDSCLKSKSIWGILRGLETFSQILYRGAYGQKLVNATKIHDYPRFSHRGILLDTARHYLSKDTILKALEAMAYNKINVFHWHIVDDQSFPYQSIMYPAITEKGAYDPVTHVYTQIDIAEIIEFARLRGIRVVPEFDTPGHSESWGRGKPGLLTPCYDAKGKPTGDFGPIDPSNNATFTFLKSFMLELTKVFRDHYLHLGGDEVSFSCWQSNPIITKFMQQMSFGTDYSKLESYYVKNLLEIVSSYKAGYIVWQEVFDNHVKLRDDTVVHVWKGGYQDELGNVTKAGYHALLSSPWYLDHIITGADWETYYKVEPLDFTGSAAQKELVQGGEACLWGEWVDNTNVLSRLWPRASAIAERLWSSMAVTDMASAADRMEEHRCRMVARGIPAEPPSGPGFCADEYWPV